MRLTIGPGGLEGHCRFLNAHFPWPLEVTAFDAFFFDCTFDGFVDWKAGDKDVQPRFRNCWFKAGHNVPITMTLDCKTENPA